MVVFMVMFMFMFMMMVVIVVMAMAGVIFLRTFSIDSSFNSAVALTSSRKERPSDECMKACILSSNNNKFNT